MSAVERSTLLFAILQHLESLKDPETEEGVDVAMQCISDAFQLDITDEAQVAKFSLDNSLPDLFMAGRKALKPPDAAEFEAVSKKYPDLWAKWMDKLKSKGFFDGVAEGSKEYTERHAKALSKFVQRMEAQEAKAGATEGNHEEAEKVKIEGNDAMKAKDYEKAVACYEKAYSLSSAGPTSHIYLANKAAALCHLNRFEEAVSSCETAIELDPDYHKAYSRKGLAHFHLAEYEEAIQCYEKVLELDPQNAMAKESLKDAQANLAKSDGGAGGANTPPMGGGMPGGLPPGMEGLGGMMNNPEMKNMANQFMSGGGINPNMMQSMMQNPAMMSMAQSVMQNPAMMQGIMGMMGNMGGGGSPGGAPGGMPDLSALQGMMAGMGGMPGMPGAAGADGGATEDAGDDDSAPEDADAPGFNFDPAAIERLKNSPQMAELKADPEMATFFADLESGGPAAAMRHCDNAGLMKKLTDAVNKADNAS